MSFIFPFLLQHDADFRGNSGTSEILNKGTNLIRLQEEIHYKTRCFFCVLALLLR